MLEQPQQREQRLLSGVQVDLVRNKIRAEHRACVDVATSPGGTVRDGGGGGERLIKGGDDY